MVSVDVYSYSYYEEAYTVKNMLIHNLHSSYEQLFTSAYSLEPMRDSFFYLAKHIKDFSDSSTLNEYLADNEIKVERTYANISNLAGDPVSESNIK